MRVGIITELMDERPAGMGSYVRSLVGALLEEDRGTDYVLIHGGRGGSELYGKAEEVSVGTGGPLDRSRRKFWKYPAAIRKARLDVVHYPDYFGPFLRAPPCPAVETIHDLVPFVMPGAHMRDVNFTFRRVFPRFIAPKVSRFIAVSRNTASDMDRYLGIGPDRVTVVPEAADPSFRPLEGQDVKNVLKKHGLKPGFILSVGTLEPRKNLARLVEAYSALVGRGVKRKLVLAGKKGWMYDEVFAAVAQHGLQKRVVHLDYLPFGDLPALYAGASVMAYPSLYEGFGLPPLEAMACGCPVVTSDRSSIPEVVGGAALTVDPEDTDALSRALGRVLEDPALADRLRDKGLRRAAGFSWKKTAKKTARVYKAVSRG